MSCKLVLQFHVLHFQVLHFQLYSHSLLTASIAKTTVIRCWNKNKLQNNTTICSRTCFRLTGSIFQRLLKGRSSPPPNTCKREHLAITNFFSGRTPKLTVRVVINRLQWTDNGRQVDLESRRTWLRTVELDLQRHNLGLLLFEVHRAEVQ